MTMIKTITTERNHNQSKDRLSSLPDAILVDILSLLPLNTAIITDTLSKRWRHLWTQITSVVIDDCAINSKYVFGFSINHSVHKLTSPLINTFVVDFLHIDGPSAANIPINLWVDRICQRNIRHLSVSLRNCISSYCAHKVQWPSCIFKTRSLVSLKLRSAQIHYPSNDELIDLPNLKKLSMNVTPLRRDWLIKLTESCPLLEHLSFDIKPNPEATFEVKCSCPNLRRLFIGFLGHNYPCEVVINAPELEYMDVSLRSKTTLCIRDRPIIRLNEVRLNIIGNRDGDPLIERSDLQLYKAISNARSLTLSANALTTFTMFPNLTRLTLSVGYFFEFKTMMSFVQFCPVLEVLNIRFNGRPWFVKGEWLDILSTRTLERVKEIGIDVSHARYDLLKLEEHFTEIIDYLLKTSSVLERFCFSVKTRTNPSDEYMFCDLLYNCPRASMDCEVSFTGQFWSMTCKAGSKLLKPVALSVN